MKRSREKKRPIQLLLHAPDGVIPYLTPLLLQKHFSPPQPHLLLAVAVQDTCLTPRYATPEASKPKGYEFQAQRFQKQAYLREYPHIVVPSFSLWQDAKEHNQSGIHATDQAVSLWTLQGRQALSNSSYIDIVNHDSSAMAAVSLFDIAVPEQPPARQEQAVRRNQIWIEELLDSVPETTQIWAPALSVSEEMREHKQISGWIVVDHRCSSIEEHLTSDKILAVLAVDTFQDILNCLELGVDVLGTHLPTTWAQSDQAFCLDFLGWNKKGTSRAVTVNMSHIQYARDQAPMVEGCACMACQRYSRAYLHHLIQAKELLAKILLMVHNLHHFLKFCQCMTEMRSDGKLERFIETAKTSSIGCE
jgi:hypothetical protein